MIAECAPTDLVILTAGEDDAARAIAKAFHRSFPSIVSETKADAIDLDTGALPRAGVICRDAIVISCIGATVSTPVILERLNHLVPLAWAKAAQAAGARQFIHLSSISVYGAATSIDAHTPLGPVTVYGRTRLAGERALGELSDPDFPVMLLRIPALIGDGDRKVASLIRLFAAIGLVPKFAPPVTRSMLSHGALAAVIGRAISARSDGVQVAADPEPFSYEMICEEAQRLGRRFGQVPVPMAIQTMTRRLLPGMHQRLFASSTVMPEINAAASFSDYRGVRDIVAGLLGRPEG